MARLLIISVSLLGLLAGALFWSGGAAESPADFTFVNRGDIRTLDPRRISWLEDIRIAHALYEGLYTLDPLMLDPIPGAADRIEISDDKTVYTFHIRPEARWSNGESLEAHDFAFSWRRTLESPGSDYAYLFNCIRGAEEYRRRFAAGETPDFKPVGIEALSPKALRVSLLHPVPYFPDLCAFPTFFPLNERAMAPFRVAEGDSSGADYRPEFMRPPHFVGNGPYRLERWEFRKRMRLVANEHYWDRQHVRSRIVDLIITNENKLGDYLRYQTGVVDWLPDVDAIIAAELLERGRRDPAQARRDLHLFPYFGTEFYTINCQAKLPDGRDNPFHDVRVRKAFALSVDKRPIIEAVTRLDDPIAQHYIPPGSIRGYKSPPPMRYDVSEARRLLSDAGFPGGRGFPALRLTFNSGFSHGEVAQIVRRQWLEKLGIAVELEAVEPKIFTERRRNREFAIARAQWLGDYNDISTFVERYLSASGKNDAGWSNQRYDQLCERMDREIDPVRRMAMAREAETILLDEAPLIPLFHPMVATLFRDNVEGIPTHPLDLVMLKHVYVER